MFKFTIKRSWVLTNQVTNLSQHRLPAARIARESHCHARGQELPQGLNGDSDCLGVWGRHDAVHQAVGSVVPLEDAEEELGLVGGDYLPRN